MEKSTTTASTVLPENEVVSSVDCNSMNEEFQLTETASNESSLLPSVDDRDTANHVVAATIEQAETVAGEQAVTTSGSEKVGGRRKKLHQKVIRSKTNPNFKSPRGRTSSEKAEENDKVRIPTLLNFLRQ